MRTREDIEATGAISIGELAEAVGISAHAIRCHVARNRARVAVLIAGEWSTGGRVSMWFHPLMATELHPTMKRYFRPEKWTREDVRIYDARRGKQKVQYPGFLCASTRLRGEVEVKSALNSGKLVTAIGIAKRYGVSSRGVNKWLRRNDSVVIAFYLGTFMLSKRGRPSDVYDVDIYGFFDPKTRNAWRGKTFGELQKLGALDRFDFAG
jgi:hypothetical protein